MTIAEKLSEFLVNTRYDDLPDQAVDHAAMIVSSTLASAAYGANISSARIVRDLSKNRGGQAEASIWFDSGPKLPLVSAARTNAMMSDAAASDDSDLRNIVHAGTPLTAVSLAVAEKTGASGKDILAAIVTGYEAAGRIGEAISPSFNPLGHHGCKGAVFGGTIAAARLLELDSTQTAHAMTLTATSIGGLSVAASTSVAREYHAGLAAMLSIEAVLAAKMGYTGEMKTLEAPKGFFQVYGGSDGAGVLDGLGDDWDIVTDMALKLSPGGHPYHAFAEAAANAARSGGITPDEIASITASRPGLTKLSGPRHPEDLIDMAHSPSYFLAAGAADRDFNWSNASPEKIADPTIHRLIDLIKVGSAPVEDVDKYRQGATVTIETKDGRTATNTVFVPKGAGCEGIDWADVDAKYRALTPHAPLNDSQIDASLAVIHDFRTADGASALIDLLR
ncbi:MAG: hypothetical protein HOI19_07290 [Rhodospirillaceae bacterium]|jgi:2-methylcitrate dehydratase PrpD|nr:hypothetical protein [Rhodospirillaceae bacterium]